MSIDQAFELAVQQQSRGQANEAEGIFRQILSVMPEHFGSLQMLATAMYGRNRFEDALVYVDQALSVRQDMAETHYFRAVVLASLSREAEAIASLQQAILLRPDYLDALTSLGVLLYHAGQIESSVQVFQRAHQISPATPEICIQLGQALTDLGRAREAITVYQQALGGEVGKEELMNKIGNAFRRLGQLDDAEEAYRSAINLKADFANAWSNLGTLLQLLGRTEESESAMRQAVALFPGDAPMLTALAFSMCFYPRRDDRAILHELRQWDQQFAQPLRKAQRPCTNDRNPDRRLRIAYVSPNFRDHCQKFFMLPLLAHHDHERFEIICYSDVIKPDATTSRMRSLVDRWQSTLGMSDDAMTQMIRRDQVDVLVDLTMHMNASRIMVFNRKPAPVQIAWLAYPGTTGLATMDYRLSDPYIDPPGSETGKYSEETVLLPETFWCYDALSDEPLSEPPALAGGFVTFGNLNNFSKFTDEVAEAWAKILLAVDRSRLLMLCPPGRSRQRVSDRLKQLGVDPERVEFVGIQPREEYLKTYHRIDIGIDTFPCNGHTTSLDSYFMGVPVVTLVRDKAVGRAGWSQLNNLQLTDLAAWNVQDYVNIATALANDLGRLSELRRTLRPRMKSSPLGDAPRFARNIESAYRQLFGRWCRKQS